MLLLGEMKFIKGRTSIEITQEELRAFGRFPEGYKPAEALYYFLVRFFNNFYKEKK